MVYEIYNNNNSLGLKKEKFTGAGVLLITTQVRGWDLPVDEPLALSICLDGG